MSTSPALVNPLNPQTLGQNPELFVNAGPPDAALVTNNQYPGPVSIPPLPPLYPEFLKLQPTGTTRVLFTPQVEEAMYQGMQAIIQGSKPAKTVMEEVEAASKKAGERKFSVG